MNAQLNPRNLKYTAFFWDFDGCLFNTYPSMNQTFQRVLQEDFNIEESIEQITELTHISISHCARKIATKYSLDAQEISSHYSHRYYETSIDIAMPPIEGIPEICKMIYESGGHHYIFTHRRNKSVKNLLEKYHLSYLFDEIVSPDLGFFHKPSPAMLFYLIDKYDIPSEKGLALGDRSLDVETGINAGVATCFYSPQNEKVDQATYQISHFSELQSILFN